MPFVRVDPLRISESPELIDVLRHSAVLMMDCQNDYLHPEGLLQRLGLAPTLSEAERSKFVGSANAVAAAARAAGRPVIWLKTELLEGHIDSGFSPEMEQMGLGPSSGFLIQGSWGAQLIEGLTPAESDVVITKKGHSPFQFTHLDRLLSNLDNQALILVGGGIYDGMKETLFQASMLGYELVTPPECLAYADVRGFEPTQGRSIIAGAEDVIGLMKGGLGSDETPQAAPSWALVIVDIQNDFLHPDGWHPRHFHAGRSEPHTWQELTELTTNNQKLIDAAHSVGAPVVFVGTHARVDNMDRAWPKQVRRFDPIPEGDPYLPMGGWGEKFLEPLNPEPRDFVVMKRGNSGFGLTHLHRLLRNLGVTSLYVTGGGVHGCVEHTIRDGVGLGYSVTLATDAIYGKLNPMVLASHAAFGTTDEIAERMQSAVTAV